MIAWFQREHKKLHYLTGATVDTFGLQPEAAQQSTRNTGEEENLNGWDGGEGREGKGTLHNEDYPRLLPANKRSMA